jgi:hypothetical protein
LLALCTLDDLDSAGGEVTGPRADIAGFVGGKWSTPTSKAPPSGFERRVDAGVDQPIDRAGILGRRTPCPRSTHVIPSMMMAAPFPAEMTPPSRSAAALGKRFGQANPRRSGLDGLDGEPLQFRAKSQSSESVLSTAPTVFTRLPKGELPGDIRAYSGQTSSMPPCSQDQSASAFVRGDLYSSGGLTHQGPAPLAPSSPASYPLVCGACISRSEPP